MEACEHVRNPIYQRGFAIEIPSCEVLYEEKKVVEG